MCDRYADGSWDNLEFQPELGVQSLVSFCDPLCFPADGNAGSFKRRRPAEVKHSGVCLIASIGNIQPEVTGECVGSLSLSGGLMFVDIPNVVAGISNELARSCGQIVDHSGFIGSATISACEGTRVATRIEFAQGDGQCQS